MAKEEFYDAVAERKEMITSRWKSSYDQAKEASDEGKLKLIHEEIRQPYTAHAFSVKKSPPI